MPFKKGHKLGGRRKEKHFYDALMLSLKDIDDDDKPAIRVITEKLVSKAKKGEPWAVQMVADRLDGKPDQAIHNTIEDTSGFADLTLAELATRTAERLAAIENASSGDGVATIEEKEPSKLH